MKKEQQHQRTHFFLIGTALLTFVSLAVFTFRQTPLLQLLSMLFIFLAVAVFVVSVVSLVKKRGYRNPRCYLPLLTLFLSIVVAPVCGKRLRDIYFSLHLAEWKVFALTVPDSSPRDGLTWGTIPVSAGTTKSGHRYVYFWWGGGFPVKHTVLAYHGGSPEQAIADFRKQWRGHHFKDNWFILSD